MRPDNDNELLLISADELGRRVTIIRRAMEAQGLPALLLSSNVSLYYLTGRVLAGWAHVPASGAVRFFVRRPAIYKGDNVVTVRKMEDLAAYVADSELGVEMDALVYSEIARLGRALPNAHLLNGSPVMRDARSTKTDEQIGRMRASGAQHVRQYSKIPGLFEPGMTDLDLQYEIEHSGRVMGNLGQFRVGGTAMEIFAGSVLVGDNADAPSPYDFAMGGAGADPSLPVGASGEEIRRGQAVMVDMGGDFNGYMTDMSRVYSFGHVPELAQRAHQCSIDIHREITTMMKPGAKCSELYDRALEMVRERGLGKYFMGHRYQAGFVGHGVGIEINEAPVLSPRSRDVLRQGNTVALEPKFVIPHVGAVGVENTYALLTSGKLENLTPAPEPITEFLV